MTVWSGLNEAAFLYSQTTDSSVSLWFILFNLHIPLLPQYGRHCRLRGFLQSAVHLEVDVVSCSHTSYMYYLGKALTTEAQYQS